ncbi:AAA family ATPase [Agromyces mariniharenae]|uniref:ATP-dependent Clp protease ATP-binding subunit n=1 Tax=Agromyces mariniharenae TaxID=2604423 RepID=A0A5S4UX72_9MICO|nr:AAA family ATPase [Agromyces mariniharenae]TYL51172.1 ATP-dependent Clp protease ATP-binding subunit [Agromyces mariniharenae]
MTRDTTKVTIYYGPLSWFEMKVKESENDGLLEAVFEHDERRRELRVVQDGAERSEPEPMERPKRLVAKSGDYASLHEHVISNFPGLIRSLNPAKLHLHNPPEQVHAHLKRAFPGTSVKRFKYPTATRQTLVDFRDGFAGHLVGQEDVRDTLLAALYPLTRASRDKPVVIMFFGPSGVGKTETAQFINGLLGGDLMRKQFSMFHSENFASYLFGGRHSEASFARDLLDRESGVILIDEFDKAAAVFHSAFYQFFDGGVFEDKNYRVDVGRSLIICTSNYGSEQEIRNALGDALFSRFDALIPFQPLSVDEVRTVVHQLVDRRVSELDRHEQAALDAEDIKERLEPLVRKAANVRRLGKVTNEVISMLLVDALLASEPERDQESTSKETAG